MPAQPSIEKDSSKKGDVLRHLGVSLQTQSRRYRKRLKRCQEHFSEEAVHDSRVETRRLLATVELLVAFVPQNQIEKATEALKEHLDTFDKLRDTQVQLIYVERLVKTFPAGKAFHEWLREREERFTRKTRKAVNDIKTKRLNRYLRDFEKEILRKRKDIGPEEASAMVTQAMNRAFARVAQLCRQVKATDTETIHRTRIAFKRFRYMVEALAPLLPGFTEEYRNAMRGYQSMMGDIQDVEVLIATFNKYVRDEKVGTARIKRLRDELKRRRQWLVRVFLGAANRLRAFWPPGQTPTPPPPQASS